VIVHTYILCTWYKYNSFLKKIQHLFKHYVVDCKTCGAKFSDIEPKLYAHLQKLWNYKTVYYCNIFYANTLEKNFEIIFAQIIILCCNVIFLYVYIMFSFTYNLHTCTNTHTYNWITYYVIYLWFDCLLLTDTYIIVYEHVMVVK